MAGTAARMLAWAAELLARSRKLRYEGIAMASRIPRMMMTTRSSIRVKPCSLLVRVRSVSSMWCGSFGESGREGCSGACWSDRPQSPTPGSPERVVGDAEKGWTCPLGADRGGLRAREGARRSALVPDGGAHLALHAVGRRR